MNTDSVNVLRHIDELTKRYPSLSECRQDIEEAFYILKEAYEGGHKLLVAGNGGSAADAEHIAGEMMKKFRIRRQVPGEFAEKLTAVDPERGRMLAANLEQSLTTVPLVTCEAITTAYMNDVDAIGVFAQQLYGFGRCHDVFLGISTSGNSENIISACVVAKALDMKVIVLTGAGGGKLAGFADVAIKVPETETYLIQELHLPVYHCLCMMLEEQFFKSE